MDNTPSSPPAVPVLSLAFLGDSVYELMVREHILSKCAAKPEALHAGQIGMSNAAFQAKAADAITPFLSGEELAVFKSGRNAKTSHRPGGGTVAQYHAATGLEALFGRLYLDGRTGRLKELFEIIVKTTNSR